MIRFREKWPIGLILALLLHVSLFLILYANSNNDSSKRIVPSTQGHNDSRATIIINKEYPLAKTTVYTTTLDKSETTFKAGHESEESVGTSKKTTVKPIINKNIHSQINHEKDLSYSIEPEVLSDETVQKKSKVLENERTMISRRPISTESTYLDSMKNDLGLLSIDVPIQTHEINKDDNNDLTKSELEDINNQISAAINEVKERNQQKIDQMQWYSYADDSIE